MHDIPGPNRVPSNVSVGVHCQLHGVRLVWMLLKTARVDIEIHSELLKVSISWLEAEWTRNCDGARERAEAVNCFLLNGFRSVDNARCDAGLARS